MSLVHRAWLAAAIAVVAAGPAAAQGQQGFQMPSHNVFCVIEQADGSLPTDLRCDIQQTTAKPPKPPKSCTEDWGGAFAVTASGKTGYLVCHGDTIRDPSLPVLNYGQVWTQGGFTCTSQASGVKCVNVAGHGFQLAKAEQTVF